MEDKLKKDYPWLFTKKVKVMVGKDRKFAKKELKPTIEDKGSFYLITREQDASPLILSKNYGK